MIKPTIVLEIFLGQEIIWPGGEMEEEGRFIATLHTLDGGKHGFGDGKRDAVIDLLNHLTDEDLVEFI